MMKAALLLFFTLRAEAAPPRWAALDEAGRQVRAEVLAPWKKAWRDKDSKGFAALFSAPASSLSWEGRKRLRRERGGVREFDWEDLAPAETGAERIAADAGRFLGAFAALDHLELTVIDMEEGGTGPLLTVRYDLRGREKDGALRTDRGLLRLGARKSEGGWRIARLEALALETLTARAPAFKDVTAAAGLGGLPVHPRTEAIRRGGYALAAADFDGDGAADLYVGGRGPGQLFSNRGDGRFKDVTRKAGLGRDTLVKAALLADLDNDGRTDLALQRFVSDGSPELVFYKNAGGGKFSPAPAAVSRKFEHDRPMSMAAADFNGDGWLDLYVGYPGVRDFTDPELSSDPKLSHQAVYLNRGGWSFEEMGGADRPPVLAGLVRPHSALGSDLDGDGRPDIVVVDDRGDLSRFYLNLGGEGFSAAERRANLDNQGWGMMAAAGDFAGDGRQGLYFSNIDLSAGWRVLGLVERYGTAREKEAAAYGALKTSHRGNRLYRPASGRGPEASFDEVTRESGTAWAGEAPAGAEWLDYDGDGRLDLYVTNGLWSADPEQDYADEFVGGLLSGRDGAEAAGEPNSVMRFLQKSGRSFAGYQRNRLFRNDGDGRFTEVGYVTGADRVEDGYVAAVADVDSDGRPDLVLRNADPPGLDRPYSPLLILRNAGVGENRFAAVYLKGNDGASAAVNARVVLKAGGRTQTRELRALQGAVQGEQAAFFGLGGSARIESLEVDWPSGAVDRFSDLPAGRLLVKEGESRVVAIGAGSRPFGGSR